MSPPDTKAISERSGDMDGSAKLGSAASTAAADLTGWELPFAGERPGVVASAVVRTETSSQLGWSMRSPYVEAARMKNFELRISNCEFYAAKLDRQLFKLRDAEFG